MAAQIKLRPNSHNVVAVRGLKDDGGNWVNDATVQLTLYECDNIQKVSSATETWPVTLSYVAGSDGDYERTLADDLVIVEGEDYWAMTRAETPGGIVKSWRSLAEVVWDDGS